MQSSIADYGANILSMTNTLLKSYLKFAKGFQPASLVRVQLRPSFICREFEYTELHYEDNELSSRHKQNKNISSSVYLGRVRSRKQFVRVFQSEHVHARESIRLLLISIPVYLSELWCLGVLDQVNNVALLL